MTHYPIRIPAEPGYTMFIDSLEVKIFDTSDRHHDRYHVGVWDPEDECPFEANTEWHIDEFYERCAAAEDIRIVHNEVLKQERLAEAKANT